MSTSDPAQAVTAQRVAILVDAVILAQQQLDLGMLVDFAGLDEQVISLCRDTQKLPREAARALLPALSDLGDRLDVLSANLRRQATTEPPGEDQRRRALSAYGKQGDPA